jgi:uncharacterized membrane protein YeaQ/YmgE (transglycosylase-associated protein family)
MNFIIWLVVGGLIGWIASILMKTNDQQGMVLNVIVGIVGAMLGGWFIAPLFGIGTINSNDFTIAGLTASLLGAIPSLDVVNFMRRGKGRWGALRFRNHARTPDQRRRLSSLNSTGDTHERHGHPEVLPRTADRHEPGLR